MKERLLQLVEEIRTINSDFKYIITRHQAGEFDNKNSLEFYTTTGKQYKEISDKVYHEFHEVVKVVLKSKKEYHIYDRKPIYKDAPLESIERTFERTFDIGMEQINTIFPRLMSAVKARVKTPLNELYYVEKIIEMFNDSLSMVKMKVLNFKEKENENE